MQFAYFHSKRLSLFFLRKKYFVTLKFDFSSRLDLFVFCFSKEKSLILIALELIFRGVSFDLF